MPLSGWLHSLSAQASLVHGLPSSGQGSLFGVLSQRLLVSLQSSLVHALKSLHSKSNSHWQRPVGGWVHLPASQTSLVQSSSSVAHGSVLFVYSQSLPLQTSSVHGF